MWRLEAEHQCKWRLGAAVDEVDRVVGTDVVHPAYRARHDAVDQEGRVRVATLPDIARMLGEARSVALAAHVPLSEIAGAVAGGPEKARERRVGGRKRGVVVRHTIEMVVGAGQEGRAAGRAQRADDKGVAEVDALSGQTVHVRRRVGQPRQPARGAEFPLHDAHGIPALIVGQ
jgi:hypothetical protein